MTDPIAIFTQWQNQAKRHTGIIEPTAACLATVAGNKPSARIVLIKEADEAGFVFYTNMESRKSMELKQNANAALCMHWMPLRKQVRIEGAVTPVSDAEADAYFATRPREAQIGAWASSQSHPLENRDALLRAVATYAREFEGKPVPRPPFWSGWRLKPEVIEFWQQGDFRLHDREVYLRKGNSWVVQRLYP